MQRVAGQHLKKWIENERRKPLVIRGARQVGKSTLVRQFAEENKLILNEINLEQHLELNNIFETLDTKLISKELEGLLGRKIISPGSILFLDEIQATPNALQALRYFYEELPELPVVAAGSLLEFVLSKHNFSMPVGRIEYVHLGPMTFEEYLSEIDESLLKHIVEFDFSDDIPKTVQKKLLDRQREYLLVGGMPEAILNYLKSMLQFVYSKNARLSVRFDLIPPSIQKVKHSQRQADSTSYITFELISLPLYMVGQLARILSLYRTGSLTVFPQNGT